MFWLGKYFGLGLSPCVTNFHASPERKGWHPPGVEHSKKEGWEAVPVPGTHAAMILPPRVACASGVQDFSAVGNTTHHRLGDSPHLACVPTALICLTSKPCAIPGTTCLYLEEDRSDWG